MVDAAEIEKHKGEYAEFLTQFLGESDRAALVLGAAQLDAMLQDILTKFLVEDIHKSDPMFEHNGALGTFSAKIEMAYRLALIDGELRKKIHLVRSIRNDAAHKIAAVDLTAPSNADRIRELVSSVAALPFWKAQKAQAEQLYKLGGPTLDLRLMIAFLTASLKMVEYNCDSRATAKPFPLIIPTRA